MKKVYFRLVKSRHNIYDRLISWYTRSPYVHAEFAWPIDKKFASEWLGAQPKGGVAIRGHDYLKGEKYDLFSISVRESDYAILRAWLKRQIGKKYDWKAIINMGKFEHDVMSPNKWFCSELVFAAFFQIGYDLLRLPYSERDRITPRDIGLSCRITQIEH